MAPLLRGVAASLLQADSPAMSRLVQTVKSKCLSRGLDPCLAYAAERERRTLSIPAA
jgi:hypothetical protein